MRVQEIPRLCAPEQRVATPPPLGMTGVQSQRRKRHELVSNMGSTGYAHHPGD